MRKRNHVQSIPLQIQITKKTLQLPKILCYFFMATTTHYGCVTYADISLDNITQHVNTNKHKRAEFANSAQLKAPNSHTQVVFHVKIMLKI